MTLSKKEEEEELEGLRALANLLFCVMYTTIHYAETAVTSTLINARQKGSFHEVNKVDLAREKYMASR